MPGPKPGTLSLVQGCPLLEVFFLYQLLINRAVFRRGGGGGRASFCLYAHGTGHERCS